MQLKILNAYCGIGGNRKNWGNSHKITAVENNKEIAKIYQDFFPDDKVIIADAHQYLLDHYKEFDFIWSSPPCPTHSDIRRCGVHAGQYEALYPDMQLYQEIILLRHFAKCKWVVENVKSYYKPLIKGELIHRHLFWSNFYIPKIEIEDDRNHCNMKGTDILYEFDLNNKNVKEKRKLLRNMVNPKLGKHILDCALGKQRQKPLL